MTTDVHTRILLELNANHVGRDRAISMPDLARCIFNNPRQTRQIQRAINELRSGGHPIGSSSNKPNGYWIENDVESIRRTRQELMARALNTMRTARALRRHEFILTGQMQMDLK